MQPPGYPPGPPPGPPYPPQQGQPPYPQQYPPQGQYPPGAGPPGRAPFRTPWNLAPDDPNLEKGLVTYAVPGTIISTLSLLSALAVAFGNASFAALVGLAGMYALSVLVSWGVLSGKHPTWSSDKKLRWSLLVGSGTLGYVMLALGVLTAVLALVGFGLLTLACGGCR